MQKQPVNGLEITEADLSKHLKDAQSYLDNARQSVRPKRTVGTYVSQTLEDQVSFSGVVRSLDSDDPLLTEKSLLVLRSVRRGLQVGFYLADQYRQRAGISNYEAAGDVPESQMHEYNQKMQVASAITLFVFARYVLWSIQDELGDNTFIGNLAVEFDSPLLSTPRSAVMHMMYYLGKCAEEKVQKSEERLMAVVNDFAQMVEEAVLTGVDALDHTKYFTDVSYGLADTSFEIAGFDLIDFGGATSIEFNRVEMERIVGNYDAKHFVRRLAQRIVCYNMAAGKNIFVELGGLTPVWMGFGKPGTGKSMLIAALATMLYDYCKALGIPFLFHPMPDNIIDSFQGNSAKNMVAWMKAAHDPNRITFMPIDDAENNLEERTRQGVSEGVRSVIGVFLRYTEGAYAINRGNASIGIFTNIAEQIDAAVRSRIQARMVIDGASTAECFLDQDFLYFRKYEGQEGFINLAKPGNYTYMDAQGVLKSMGDAEQTHDKPTESEVLSVFDAVLENYDVGQHEFFAHLYMGFMEKFPTFSSRDVRNIQSAVDQRVMDFDLPDEWFESPEIFTGLDYETQKGMVLELRNGNMKGLSFADIYRQEVIRYMDSYVTIANAEFERLVEDSEKHQRVAMAVQEKMRS